MISYQVEIWHLYLVIYRVESLRTPFFILLPHFGQFIIHLALYTISTVYIHSLTKLHTSKKKSREQKLNLLYFFSRCCYIIIINAMCIRKWYNAIVKIIVI